MEKQWREEDERIIDTIIDILRHASPAEKRKAKIEMARLVKSIIRDRKRVTTGGSYRVIIPAVHRPNPIFLDSSLYYHDTHPTEL
jgi:hypothetical protein